MTGQESLTDSDAAILRNVREGKPLFDPQVARLRDIQRQYGFTFAPKPATDAPQAGASPSPTPSPAPPAPTPSPTPTPQALAPQPEPQVPPAQPPARSPAPAMGLRNTPEPLPTTPPEFKNDEEARTWLNAAARSSEIRLTESQHALRERLNDQAGDDLSRALSAAGDMLPGLADLVSGVVGENMNPGLVTTMLLAPGNTKPALDLAIKMASKPMLPGQLDFSSTDDAALAAATGGEGARKISISTRQIADWAASQVQTANFEREREDMVRQQLGDAAYEFPPLLRQEVERRKAAKEAPYDDEGTARRNALTYEIYNRNKDLEQAFEGRPEYYQGGKLVQRTPDIFGASPVTISNPITGNTVAPLPYTSTGLAVAGDPLNAAAGAFGGLSKLRLLSRAGSRLGVPLGGIEKGGKTAGAALTGFADRLEDLVSRPRIDPATGQPLPRSLNLSTVSAATGITAGTVLYQMDDSGTLAAGVGAIGLAPLALRGAGFTFQKVGSSAGKWSVIAREMAAGPLGSGSTMKTPATQAAAIRAARPAVAEELLATGNVPPQYAKYMRTATDDRGLPTMSVPAARGADSTLKRVAQNREAPPEVRIAARAMDRSGLTGGFRMLDDAFSGGVSGTAFGLPFAAIAPEPEYAGAILGGSALFGAAGGPIGGRMGRSKESTDSDVARMMVDVKSRGGDPFTIVQQAKPKELAATAAMQGIMANKGIDFMPLRADEYGAMVPEAQGGRGYHTTRDKDGRQTYFVNMGHYADFDGRVRIRDIGDGNVRVQVVKGGQDPYSFVVPESRKGRLRVKDGDEVKAGQMLDNTMSNSLLAAAHEFMHPIMLSDMFAGPHKPVLHGLMYDMYGPEGIEARKREYVGLMVDDDIASGVSPGSRVEYTAQEQSDMATGKRTPADIMRERGVVDKTRDELIADKIAELDDQYQREFGDRNAWIADEMLSEYWRSYGNEIDINKLRGSKSPFDRARAAEGVSVFNQRLLGLLGMKFNPQTGKPLTIPSQLFRDNPLIDTPVIRRRVNETVRLYDQYLQGLEDAGAVDAPGTPLPKTDNPNNYVNDSRVVMPEDPSTGVKDDDFAVVGPNGSARFRSPEEIKEIEKTRAAQVADMASRESGREAAGGEFGMHTDPSGRKILRGDKLPDSFYLLKSFPEHAKVFSRQLDEVQDRGGVVEVTFNRVGEKNDGGSWKPTANRSAAESVTRRMIPFGRQVSKTNQILAEFLDLDAVNAAAMKMINNNELPAFNNDLGQLTADLKTYLANHRAGRPGETGLTIEKRNILNALVGTGTAVQRKANPLVGSVNARGAVRTVRLDRIVRLKDTAEDGLGFDNDRVKGNRMPDAEPVPDVAPEQPVRGQASPNAEAQDVPIALPKPPRYAKNAPIKVEGGKYINQQVVKSDSSVPKNILETNPQAYFDRLGAAAQKIIDDPARMADPNGYLEYMRDAGVWGDVLYSPPTLRTIIDSPQQYVDNLLGGYHGSRTKPGTMEAADAGLDATIKMREAIGERPPPMVTALHHFWGILSRMLKPVEQESGWLRLISRPAILEQIQRSIDGQYMLQEKQWSALVQKELRASNDYAKGRGNQATANANAFHAMLAKWNGEWDRVSDVYAAPDSIESGRRFWSLGLGAVGIRNKVQRFIGLTYGTPGLIMDRWKFVEFYYPQFGKRSQDYFKYSSAGTPEDPMGIYGQYGNIEGQRPFFSLAFYEGMEMALRRAIESSPELQQVLGRHANVGGMHWKGWNAIKNEAVGHSSLDLTYDMVRANPNPTPETLLQLLKNKEYYTEGLVGNRIERFTLPLQK